MKKFLCMAVCFLLVFTAGLNVLYADDTASEKVSGTEIESLTAKRKAFIIKFDTVSSGISGYQVWYSTKKTFSSYVKLNIGASSSGKKAVKNLKGGKTYYVKIRTYLREDGEVYYSEWSDVSCVTTCKYLVAIDAGHQKTADLSKEANGPGSSVYKCKVTAGATGVYTGLYEYKLNLAVAKKLKKELLGRGYDVYMIRTKNDVNIANSTRAKMANEKEANIVIHIHANSLDDSSVYGALTMCMTKNSPYNADLYKKSYKLSKKIVDSLASKTGTKNLGVTKTTDLTGVNYSEIPVTFVEMGFMSNEAEDKKMATTSYQDEIAEGIADGIEEYFE
ncbi:MAG: N-acetylmuramoyl-L-alanine amidase [Eubacterium sp.]|nr:N-acetylmuramoyl-L-alanine amidase [Eubacterium sp.]